LSGVNKWRGGPFGGGKGDHYDSNGEGKGGVNSWEGMNLDIKLHSGKRKY